MFNGCIRRFTGLYHDQNFARGFQGCHELFNGERACEVFAFSFFQKIIGFLRGTVKYRHREASAFNVKGQIFAHYCKSNDTDLLFCHLGPHPLLQLILLKLTLNNTPILTVLRMEVNPVPLLRNEKTPQISEVFIVFS
ncbi:hypothetical protein PIL02S_03896 [Paenibacillus illinoisensis]|uniref:Uncharacterized protein n=1 Tax=Paenibacillus illinoisensis TaxID=59845 RepID=A0A2W0CHN4_9BACL|nr:hypothetical protein PIL02S_03896 [Paenibacillus illinoisensis]